MDILLSVVLSLYPFTVYTISLFFIHGWIILLTVLMSLEETCTQPLFLLLMIQVKCLYYKYIKRSLLLEIMTVNSHLKSVTHTKDTINYYFSFFNELEHSLISEYFINLGVDVF